MRKGTAIFLDEVLDEAVSRARATIAEKIGEGRTELTAEEQDELGQAIGLGAVVYNDLYQGPDRAIRFDWDVMLAFDGNSAPYIQYTHARCRSTLTQGRHVRGRGGRRSADRAGRTGRRQATGPAAPGRPHGRRPLPAVRHRRMDLRVGPRLHALLPRPSRAGRRHAGTAICPPAADGGCRPGIAHRPGPAGHPGAGTDVGYGWTMHPGLKSGSAKCECPPARTEDQAPGAVPVSTQVDNRSTEDPDFNPGDGCATSSSSLRTRHD